MPHRCFCNEKAVCDGFVFHTATNQRQHFAFTSRKYRAVIRVEIIGKRLFFFYKLQVVSTINFRWYHSSPLQTCLIALNSDSAFFSFEKMPFIPSSRYLWWFSVCREFVRTKIGMGHGRDEVNESKFPLSTQPNP